MIRGTEQTIENGSGNIQAARDVNIVNNHYFKGYKPVGIRFYENDICIVLEAFNTYSNSYFEEPNLHDKEFELICKPEKNQINNLSPEYFQIICDEYLPYFRKVEKFLKAPQNKDYLRYYKKTAIQINFRIGVLKKYFTHFEDILNQILNDIIGNLDSNIVNDIDLFIIFMNYMYWHCDIGRRG